MNNQNVTLKKKIITEKKLILWAEIMIVITLGALFVVWLILIPNHTAAAMIFVLIAVIPAHLYAKRLAYAASPSGLDYCTSYGISAATLVAVSAILNHFLNALNVVGSGAIMPFIFHNFIIGVLVVAAAIYISKNEDIAIKKILGIFLGEWVIIFGTIFLFIE